MADFDHITVNGTTKYAKDSTARAGLADKVDKVAGYGLSEEDFTSTLKTKLDSIAAGAEVNVQSNWTEADATSDAYIQNKPTIPDDASEIDYDNTVSGLVATDVQAAIDEIVASSGSDPNKMDKVNPTGTGAFSLNRGTGGQIGNYSTAEGKDCLATQDYAHAEGFMTQALDESAHAEGDETVASGARAHAEGLETIASGSNSHAEGLKTKASSANQHVSGQYNVEDTLDTYAEIIGNGTADNARSNARTLDWNGNETIAGDLYFNGGVNPLSAQLAAKADPPSNYDGQTTAAGTAVSHGSTWTTLLSVNITAGTWLVSWAANFATSGGTNTGYRGAGVATTGDPFAYMAAQVPAVTNNTYTLVSGCALHVATGTQTLNLKVRQYSTSGTSLTVTPRLQVIKIL